MGALSTATWRGYSRWVSLCFNDKDLYDDWVLINKFKRCYGSVGLQAVLLSQNDHDSRWFDWKITSVGFNSATQRIKLIHILQLQPNWERSCESSDINCFFLPFLSLLDVSSMLLSYAANCSILHSLSQIKSIEPNAFIEPNQVSTSMACPGLIPLCYWSFVSRTILCVYRCAGSALYYSALGLVLQIWLSNLVGQPSFGVETWAAGGRCNLQRRITSFSSSAIGWGLLLLQTLYI